MTTPDTETLNRWIAWVKDARDPTAKEDRSGHALLKWLRALVTDSQEQDARALDEIFEELARLRKELVEFPRIALRAPRAKKGK